MRIGLRQLVSAAILLAMASAGRARPVTVETLGGLAEKSDLLVVCEVTKIEDVATAKSERWNAMVTTKRATLRVVRGIQPSDGSVVNLDEITIEYPSIKPADALPDGPVFPVLAEGQLALFPLKHSEAGWKFVSEEDVAMVMPAARRQIAAHPATPRDYLLDELAGALINGDYPTMSLAGKYLNDLGTEVPLPPQATGVAARLLPPVADAVFALIRTDVGDNVIRQDTRWLQMGVAVYNATSMPRPAIADLLADDAPVRTPFQFARLALRKAGETDLDRRIIRLLVVHQEDPGAAWNTAATIAVNYATHPDLIGFERSALADGKPGVMAIADMLVKDFGSPLAAKAGIAARDVLDPKLRQFGQEPDAETRGHAMAILLRVGSDDDFVFFLDQIARAKAAESPRYREYLLAAQGEGGLRAGRLLAIARLYIDDTAPLAATEESKSWRVCDVAATLVGRVAEDDFGIKPGAMPELKEAGVARARKYLKSKE